MQRLPPRPSALANFQISKPAGTIALFNKMKSVVREIRLGRDDGFSSCCIEVSNAAMRDAGSTPPGATPTLLLCSNGACAHTPESSIVRTKPVPPFGRLLYVSDEKFAQIRPVVQFVDRAAQLLTPTSVNVRSPKSEC